MYVLFLNSIFKSLFLVFQYFSEILKKMKSLALIFNIHKIFIIKHAFYSAIKQTRLSSKFSNSTLLNSNFTLPLPIPIPTPTMNSNNKITETTEFVAPLKTIALANEWITQNTPSYIKEKNETSVIIKPFNKVRCFEINLDEFKTNFVNLTRDDTYVYTPFYPDGRIAIEEFSIEPISLSKIKKFLKTTNDTNFDVIIEKAHQDSYKSKGQTSCINMKKYSEYLENPQVSKLERIGDPIHNRNSRHTPPISKTFDRSDFEKCPSFPAPVGIRSEDFALPSQQNKIFSELMTQIFNCKNAPVCPDEIKELLDINVTPNSHSCKWCGSLMDISELNQEYCSKEHSVNFCHRDPVLGTKSCNVYIGHCSCNREQGGYSEMERLQQIIRLAKSTPEYRELLLKELQK